MGQFKLDTMSRILKGLTLEILIVNQSSTQLCNDMALSAESGQEGISISDKIYLPPGSSLDGNTHLSNLKPKI